MVARRRQVTLSAQDRIAQLPAQALMCRDLRHAWPRTPRDIARLVTFDPIVTDDAGRLVEGLRIMWCTGRCQVRRVDRVRRDRDGRLVRVGRATLRYPREGYRLGRPEAGVQAEPVDPDVVRDAVLRRMFPDIAW